MAFVNFHEYDRTFWTDSRTVLTLIKTPPREFRPFVSVRVAEIQETVGSEQFRYIKSKYNPADALTRGIAPGDLESWNSGPSFLHLRETEWPKFEYEVQNQGRKETVKEMKAATKWHDNSREFHAASAHEEKEDHPILCHLLQSCSTFTKIRRVLAYVHRFVDITRRRAVPNSSLTVQDLKRSELQLLKWSQLHLDVSQLDEKLIATTDEEGLIRAHGRLENARILPNDIRNPVVLPKDHPLAILLLRHLHRKRGHCSYKSLMHEARRTLWIIALRKNGQVRGQQVCRLSETAQETPTTAYGSTAKFEGSSRISSILEHRYLHVRATADQTESKNTPRSPGNNFLMCNNASGSARTCN